MRWVDSPATMPQTVAESSMTARVEEEAREWTKGVGENRKKKKKKVKGKSGIVM